MARYQEKKRKKRWTIERIRADPVTDGNRPELKWKKSIFLEAGDLIVFFCLDLFNSNYFHVFNHAPFPALFQAKGKKKYRIDQLMLGDISGWISVLEMGKWH